MPNDKSVARYTLHIRAGWAIPAANRLDATFEEHNYPVDLSIQADTTEVFQHNHRPQRDPLGRLPLMLDIRQHLAAE